MARLLVHMQSSLLVTSRSKHWKLRHERPSPFFRAWLSRVNITSFNKHHDAIAKMIQLRFVVADCGVPQGSFNGKQAGGTSPPDPFRSVHEPLDDSRLFRA
jgi:hypothetical protein